MPQVIVKNLFSKSIHCESNTEKLIEVLLTHTDWMHACGMKGKCTTCMVKVISDESSLSELTEAEKRFVNLGRLKAHHRLACQAIVLDNVTVETPEQYKLPHLNYSE